MTDDDLSSPVIMVVHHDAASLARLHRILDRRFGADYEIVAVATAHDARAELERLRESGTDVALVLSEQWLPDVPGAELLAGVQAMHRDARRGLMVTWGDRTTADWIVKASALGQIDANIVLPWRDADERFFLAVGELLTEWEQLHLPAFAAITIVGDSSDPYSYGIRDALQRSGVPHRFHEAGGEDGRALLRQAGEPTVLPIAILFDGRVLARPTPAEVAGALGVNADIVSDVLDVAIVGSGPAGLAAAVYGASEGLRVAMIESEAVGGQASSSSQIRNYLGFPRGLSGSELTNRAYQQAWLLGAQSVIGRRATALRTFDDVHVLTLDDGSEVQARAVVLATGVSYRRIGIESVDELIGRGVFYGAGVTEAPGMTGEDVYIVGGANSAGQAALYFSRFARRVTLLVRGAALGEMSEYLVREIDVRPNVAVRLQTVVEGADADHRLRGLLLRNTASGRTDEVAATALFIMIGAAPSTSWLPPEIERDDRGYVRTGEDVGSVRSDGRRPDSLETSVPGVYAVGDVRAGSMKRVAAAVGEGSSAIRLIHDHLARLQASTGAHLAAT
jgi:thioredoxin reductase (NADPH)